MLQHWRTWAQQRQRRGTRSAAAPALYARCLLRRCMRQWRRPRQGRQLLARVFGAAEAAWQQRVERERAAGSLGRSGCGQHGHAFQQLLRAVAAWRQAVAHAHGEAAAGRAVAAAGALRRATLLSWGLRAFEMAGHERVVRRGCAACAQLALRRWRQHARTASSFRCGGPDALCQLLAVAEPRTVQQLLQRAHQRSCPRAWVRAARLPQRHWRLARLRMVLHAWWQRRAATQQLLRRHVCTRVRRRLLAKHLVLWHAVAGWLAEERARERAGSRWHAARLGRLALTAWRCHAISRQQRLGCWAQLAACSAADRLHAAWLLRRMLARWRLLVCKASAAMGYHSNRLRLAALLHWRQVTLQARAQARLVERQALHQQRQQQRLLAARSEGWDSTCAPPCSSGRRQVQRQAGRGAGGSASSAARQPAGIKPGISKPRHPRGGGG